MATESELREQFHEGEPSPGSIDVDAVLRRSRARRRPQLAAVGVVSALAVLAIVVPLSVSGVFGHVGVVSGSSASVAEGGANAPQFANNSDGGAGEPGTGAVNGLAPAEQVNLCSGALAHLAPATNGLVLTVQPVEAAATDRDIHTTVTLTNTGPAAFRGSASPFPALTFSRDGTVLWHSNGPVAQLVQAIDVAPGASTTFTTVFQPLVCGVADEKAGSFREVLPAAGPGGYQLSAVLAVTDTAGTRVLVSGPATAVTLH